VTRVCPLIGPRAGGTDVTITGRELDTGNSVQVLLDDVPCIINWLAAVSMHLTYNRSL